MKDRFIMDTLVALRSKKSETYLDVLSKLTDVQRLQIITGLIDRYVIEWEHPDHYLNTMNEPTEPQEFPQKISYYSRLVNYLSKDGMTSQAVADAVAIVLFKRQNDRRNMKKFLDGIGENRHEAALAEIVRTHNEITARG